MTKWDLTPRDAFDQLAQWVHATTVMQWRIMDPAAGIQTRQSDTFLFALAARQARRFAGLVQEVVPEAVKPTIVDAICEFDDRAPDITAIRDVLDHMDDYLKGVGRTYPAGPPRSPDREYLQILKPTLMWTEKGDDTFRLIIMPAPGHKLVLDVRREGEAVRKLADTIGDVLDL